MRLPTLRATAAALAVVLTGACASDITTSPAIVTDASLASISDLPVSPASLAIRPGDVAQLTATPVNPQGTTVAQKSVQWSSTNEAVATVSSTGLVTAVASGSAEIVVTRGAHETRVPVNVDGCNVVPLGATGASGAITTLDCYFAPGNRYGDYYSVAVPAGQAQRFLATGAIHGPWGVKEATADPRTGWVYGSTVVGNGAGIRVIGAGIPLQLFIGGANALDLGAYSVTRSIEAEMHDCADYQFLVGDVTFSTTLNAANACHETIAFSPFPDAIGKPILTHGYNMKLHAGVPYTFALSNFSSDMNPGLTIFAGGVLAQSVGAYQAVRTLTVSVPVDRYVYVEISSGHPDASNNWVTPSGGYTFSVSH
jgi:hypothetical protein